MRFSVLDSWRGLAALMVALSRFPTDGRLFTSPLVVNSYLFVDFFFVLSGFVIAHAYFGGIVDGSSLRSFAIRRFGRLWPLHAVICGFFVLYEAARTLTSPGMAGPTPFTGLRAPGTILPELAFATTLGFGPNGWNHPSWSISAEFWTYLLFGALCLSLRPAFAWIAALIASVALAFVVASSQSGMDVTFQFGLGRCIAGFFVGSLTYLGWLRWKDACRLSPAAFTAAEAFSMVLALSFVWIAGHDSLSFAAPLVFALVVVVFAFEGGALSRWLMARPFQLLGKLSYSIYMTALLVAMILARAFMILDSRLGDGGLSRVSESGPVVSLPAPVLNDAASVSYLLLVVLVSSLTYRLIEAPGRQFFNGLSMARRSLGRGPTQVSAGE
ncbi:MAG: acyltransferase [Hyphomicrobiales bacterium]|nr:acyltransferase [Hyphomicrobiales bacterium]